MDFFPWWLGHIPGQQCQDSSVSSCERVEHEDTWVSGSMRGHFHTLIGHHRVPTLPHWKSLRRAGKDWRNGSTLLSSSYKISAKNVCNSCINTKSRPKMNATLDGNKCCDIRLSLCNQCKRRTNKTLECATFLLDGQCGTYSRQDTALCFFDTHYHQLRRCFSTPVLGTHFPERACCRRELPHLI